MWLGNKQKVTLAILSPRGMHPSVNSRISRVTRYNNSSNNNRAGLPEITD